VRPPVPFGQYVPVDSPVHRLEARTKMALIAAFTTLLFASGSFTGLGVGVVLLGIAVGAAGVPVRLVVRGLRAISFLLIFTLLVHSLRWNPATVSLLRVGPLAVDQAGLLTGIFFALRIVLLVVSTSLLTLTTSPVQLTDALERLMAPLDKLRVPVGELAMMLTIALRFIPTTAEEAEKIIVAQTARGARFSEGGPITRARAYVPVLVPLFVNLFRRADELATAMDARCYRGGRHRTRLRTTRLRGVDWLVLFVGCTGMIAAGVLL